MSTPLPYRAAAAEARRAGYAINVKAAREIEAALVDFADKLDAMLVKLGPSPRAAAVRATAQNVRQMAADLETRIIAAVKKGIRVTFDDTLAAWGKATQRVASAIGSVEGAALGGMPVPSITEAHAFAATRRFAEPFRTLIHDDAKLVAEDVTAIIQKAIVDGMHPEALARALRPYVLGESGPGELLPYAETVPVRARGAAYSMDHNAKRIAFTETHNARREAEVATFVADPFIGLAKWTLSPNRGTQRTPDVCDALADLDWFGLGAGVFPLAAVPTSPHPWDRCEVLPITLTTAIRAQLAAFDGTRVLDPWTVPLPGESLMTPNAIARTRSALSHLVVERVSVPPPNARAA